MKMDDEGVCHNVRPYDENDTDAVADFSAMDPEGEGIEWDVERARLARQFRHHGRRADLQEVSQLRGCRQDNRVQ